LLCAGVLFPLARAAQAQTPAPEATPATPPADKEAEGTKEEYSFLSKVQIHGYLSQAYAKSDGNQILGISKQGTLDYNTAAVLIRADVSDDDVFSVQFSHERNGVSPSQKVQPDVKLDWVFYEHHFGKSAVRVGRVKVPYGIYNEVRDVGTVLPLYRPTRDFYGEGSFTTETVDGVLLSHRFDFAGSWALTADAYYGNWAFYDTTQNLSRIDKSLGTQFFLDTPIQGLRFGAGTLRFDATAVPTRPATYWHDLHASAQASFGPVDLDVEYRKLLADLQAGGKTFYDVKTGYARLGVHLTDKLTAHAEYDKFKLKIPLQHIERDYDTEKVLALSYKFRADLVAKAEYHQNKGYYLEPAPNVLLPAAKTNYSILSLSASF
jgi:hypothetical protein